MELFGTIGKKNVDIQLVENIESLMLGRKKYESIVDALSQKTASSSPYVTPISTVPALSKRSSLTSAPIFSTSSLSHSTSSSSLSTSPSSPKSLPLSSVVTPLNSSLSQSSYVELPDSSSSSSFMIKFRYINTDIVFSEQCQDFDQTEQKILTNSQIQNTIRNNSTISNGTENIGVIFFIATEHVYSERNTNYSKLRSPQQTIYMSIEDRSNNRHTANILQSCISYIDMLSTRDKIDKQLLLHYINDNFSAICNSIVTTNANDHLVHIFNFQCNCSFKLDFLQYVANKTDNLQSFTSFLNIYDSELYAYRNIRGDGSCFYRSIIFGFLENAIENNCCTKAYQIINDLIIKFIFGCKYTLSQEDRNMIDEFMKLYEQLTKVDDLVILFNRIQHRTYENGDKYEISYDAVLVKLLRYATSNFILLHGKEKVLIDNSTSIIEYIQRFSLSENYKSVDQYIKFEISNEDNKSNYAEGVIVNSNIPGYLLHCNIFIYSYDKGNFGKIISVITNDIVRNAINPTEFEVQNWYMPGTIYTMLNSGHYFLLYSFVN